MNKVDEKLLNAALDEVKRLKAENERYQKLLLDLLDELEEISTYDYDGDLWASLGDMKKKIKEALKAGEE